MLCQMLTWKPGLFHFVIPFSSLTYGHREMRGRVEDQKWETFMGHTESSMHDVSLDFIGQNPVMWPQLIAKAENVICLCIQKEKRMNLVFAQLFIFAIHNREGKGHGLRLRDNLEEFLRIGTKVIAMAMGL